MNEFDNIKYYKDNPALNKNEITECLLDLYFYLLSGDNDESYLTDFGKKYVSLNESDKDKIRKELKNILYIKKPKIKKKER